MGKVVRAVVQIVVSIGLVVAGVITANPQLFITGLTLFGSTITSLLFSGPTFDPDEARGVQVSPSSPRFFCYGLAPIGGRITYALNTDQHQWVVYALTTHEIEDIEAIWIEEQRYELIPSGGRFRLDTNEDIGDVFRAYKLFGTSDQLAVQDLINEEDSEWTTNHRGRGVSGIIIRWEIDTDILPRGIPTTSTFFEVKGKKVYDPRKDTTQGGLGNHRLNVPDTWEWSDNPALCWLDFQKGHTENGRIIFGHGRYFPELYNQENPPPPRAILEMIPSVIKAANVCDQSVPLLNGGTQKRYTVNGAFSTTVNRDEIDRTFKESCAGFLDESPGGYRFIAGIDETPLKTYTNLTKIQNPIFGDLFTTSDVAFNIARAEYLEPQAVWRTLDASPYSDLDLIENIDRRTIPRPISLPHQINNIRSQRLSKINLRRSRGGLTLTWIEHFDEFELQPGDRIIINDPDIEIINEVFRIQSKSLINIGGQGPDRNLKLALQFSAFSDPDINYEWTPELDEQPIGIISSNPIQSLLSSPTISVIDNPNTNTLIVSWETTDPRTQSIIFSQNLLETTNSFLIDSVDINFNIDQILNLPDLPTGTSCFLLNDINNIPSGIELFIRQEAGISTLHLNLDDVNNNLNPIDITGDNAFILYLGPSQGSMIQTIRTEFNNTGTFTINRLSNAQYTITAQARAANISASSIERIEIST